MPQMITFTTSSLFEKDWLKLAIAQVIAEHQKREGLNFQSAARDVLTDVFHVVETTDATLDIEQMVAAARDVAIEEEGVAATFISVWNGGDTKCGSKCRYFPDLNVVRDIETCECVVEGTLDYQYIELADGTELECKPEDEMEEGDKAVLIED